MWHYAQPTPNAKKDFGLWGVEPFKKINLPIFACARVWRIFRSTGFGHEETQRRKMCPTLCGIGGNMAYRCEASSVEGFVQILASNYLPHGYWFYITGRVPPGKSAEVIDAKLIGKYSIGLSRQQRARRKQQGFANLHYVRFQDFFVILATHGKHPFFESEGDRVRDIRRNPLHFHGYSLTLRRGGFLKKGEGEPSAKPDGRHRVRVTINRKSLRNLRADLVDKAAHRTSDTLRWELWNQPFEPYAPIRKQYLKVLRRINQVRAALGYDKLPPESIRYQRRIVKPFAFNSTVNSD